MSDILFHRDDYVFSYRVAGILLRDHKILMQKPTNDPGYAIPGGHVEFGESTAETLQREFKEELGVEITVGALKWVAEIFFPWGDKACHQICLYYDVALKEDLQLPRDDFFSGQEQIEGRDFQIEFYWTPLEILNQLEVYPANITDLLQRYAEGVQHFVYRQDK